MSGTIVRRSHDVLSRRVGAVWLVTTPDDPEVHELAGGAAVVWELLAEPSSVEALVGELAGAGAPRDEVLSCLGSLRSIGALVEVPT